jgi:hypothetical protein
MIVGRIAGVIGVDTHCVHDRLVTRRKCFSSLFFLCLFLACGLSFPAASACRKRIPTLSTASAHRGDAEVEDRTVVLRAYKLGVNFCGGDDAADDEERISNELRSCIKVLKGEFPIDLAEGTSAARMRINASRGPNHCPRQTAVLREAVLRRRRFSRPTGVACARGLESRTRLGG